MNTRITEIKQDSFNNDYQIAMLKKIEYCGRVCYASQDKITDNSYIKFNNTITNLKHLSVLEHGEIILKIDSGNHAFFYSTYTALGIICPFRLISDANNLYIITNYRYYTETLLNIFPENVFEICNLNVFEVKHLKLQYDSIRRRTFEIDTTISMSRELNRHRCLSISEQSTRYVKADFNNFDTPNWVKENHQEEYDNLIKHINTQYNSFIDKDIKKQEARDILPLVTPTTVIYSAFTDSWNDVINKRLVKNVHPQMRMLVEKLKRML